MGAYSPAPVVTREVHDRVMREIMLPTVRGLAADGIHYRGFLYAGLMIDDAGQPRVIEFNCRLGDPETQPIVFRLRSDLLDVCLELLRRHARRRNRSTGTRAPRSASSWRAAATPTPTTRATRSAASSRSPGADVKVFHAGTRLDGNRVVTDGGRVLCVVGAGTSVRAARDAAYAGVRKITWDGAFYRKDIGHRAIQREESR